MNSSPATMQIAPTIFPDLPRSVVFLLKAKPLGVNPFIPSTINPMDTANTAI